MCQIRTTLAFIFLLSLAVSSQARSDEAWLQDWRDLSTRCRLAIEGAQSLDTTGLVALRFDDHHIEWGRQGGRFIIIDEVEAEDRLNRRCKVMLAPGAAAISTDDAAKLEKAFLAIRSALINDGGYEIRDPDPIFPTALGVGPLAHNARGCRVISGLMIDVPNKFFVSVSGEQVNDKSCGGGPSLSQPSR